MSKLPIPYTGGNYPSLSVLRRHPTWDVLRISRSIYSEMLTRLQQIKCVADLRDYVIRTICNQYQLQTGAFPVTERILRRRDKPCGIYFCVHGPRATQFSAIWETDRNKILFYGSGGEKFQTTQLTDSPQIQPYASN